MKEIPATTTTTPKSPSQIQPQQCARILRSITIDTTSQYQYQWIKNEKASFSEFAAPAPSSVTGMNEGDSYH